MSADVAVDVDAGVAVLTLNRPENRNAYTAEMGKLLSRAYLECDADDDVRAIVITGAGSAFCAGALLRRRKPVRRPGGRRHLLGIADHAGRLRIAQTGDRRGQRPRHRHRLKMVFTGDARNTAALEYRHLRNASPPPTVV